jgi:membrane protein
MERLKRVATDLVHRFQANDVPGLGAELAYRFLFAVFPFGLFVAALVAFIAPAMGINDPTGQLLGGLGDNLPPEVANAIRPELEQVIGTTRPGLLSIGAIAALWAATGGTLALMKGLNRAYEVEESRSIVTKYLVAIGLTLLAAVGIIVSFVTIVGGAVLTQQLAEELGVGGRAWSAIQLLRWPAVFIALVVAVAILYRFAPNGRAPWRWIVVGAVVFTLGWLVATFLFGLYVSNIANFGATYGSLGGVIALMLWFYLTSILLVVGGEVAAITTNVYEPGALQQRRDEIRESQLAREVEGRARDTVETAKERVGGAIDDDEPRRETPRPRPAGGPVVHSISRERPED